MAEDDLSPIKRIREMRRSNPGMTLGEAKAAVMGLSTDEERKRQGELADAILKAAEEYDDG